MKSVFLVMFLMLVGCAGEQGPQGLPGLTGPQGISGTNCTVSTVSANVAAPNGGALILCPDGSQSLVLNGSNGQTGATGAQGTAGTNGTVVAPIRLCSGTTVYPSKFVEVAFCINSTLYAVYSKNDGFLTEVVPGNYSSDGINSSCNFTVGSNCSVTRN